MVVLKPDLSLIREMSWLKSKSLLIMGDIYDPIDKNKHLDISPRNILKKQIAELRQSGNYFKHN